MVIVWGIVLCLLVMSVLGLCGKGSFLVAGYNTASKKEKARYDEKKLCRIMGIGMLVIAIILAICAVYEFDLPSHLRWLFPWGIIPVTVGMIVAANTLCKNKSIHENEEQSKTNKQNKLGTIIAASLFTFIAAAFMGIVLYTGEIDLSFDENQLNVNTSSIMYQDIISLEYTTDLESSIRTNGVGNFKIQTGNYKNDDFGDYKRYTYTNCKEYIIVYTEDTVVVLNDRDTAKTQLLYENLLEKIE